MAWKNHGNILATGDGRGLIQFCDETFRNVFVTKEAHTAAVRGLAFSPSDTKLASVSDDSKVHIWAMGRDKPERVLNGHQSDVKCVDWHDYRSLIATGSRDSTVRLWDPRQGDTIYGHKKQVNCCEWNANGNWLATGSMDGLVKLFDIRTMREIEVWRGQNSEICKIAWHPVYENLLVSGGYNGSLVYWIAGQTQTPHTMVADAHRQSIDVIAWHPVGHLLATASHDCILKFWCREPPGSRLEQVPSEANQENPPQYAYGPMDPDTPSIIPMKVNVGGGPGQGQQQGGQGGHGGGGGGGHNQGGQYQGGGGGGGGGRGNYQNNQNQGGAPSYYQGGGPQQGGGAGGGGFANRGPPPGGFNSGGGMNNNMGGGG
eukprot:gene36774-45367_t